jgi:hypothetical protein
MKNYPKLPKIGQSPGVKKPSNKGNVKLKKVSILPKKPKY